MVQECLNVILRKAEVPLDISGARTYLEHVLNPLVRVSASTHLFHRGLDIQDRYRFSFFNSMIVAAALEAGCTRLFSEDLQNGQRIETITVVNPFAT